MQINSEIIRTCLDWQQHRQINKFLIKKVTKEIVQRFDNLRLVHKCELSILLINNARMLELNQQFRNIPKPTNTLSFPDTALNWRHLHKFQPDVGCLYLGDIAFGYEIICEEALQQKKTFEHHFIHLLIHSILHLIGFDHQDDEETEIMENLEIQILQNFGVASPY